jgi:pimeloyl-ACP methyl ester carboxylesterase
MIFKQGFANNQGVKIHYIDNEAKNTNATPLLICPGLSESAEDYVNLMSNINNRRCIALSFRGRGKSDSLSKGYTLDEHIKDIDSVIKELGLKNICIMGISRGVSYELGYATSNTSLLKGLIVDEYSPEHKKMPMGWAKECMDFYNNNCDSISITYETLKGIEEDSEQINFVEKLSNITCPALILKGQLEETLIDKEDLIKYISNLGSISIRIEKFKNSGHDIQFGDFEALIKVLNEFLSSID